MESPTLLFTHESVDSYSFMLHCTRSWAYYYAPHGMGHKALMSVVRLSVECLTLIRE